MRNGFRQFRAALPMARKFKVSRHERRVRFDKRVLLSHYDFLRNRLSIQFRKGRLVIKQIELTRRATHEEKNDALGFRSEMRFSCAERVGGPTECVAGPQ